MKAYDDNRYGRDRKRLKKGRRKKRVRYFKYGTVENYHELTNVKIEIIEVSRGKRK